MENLNNEQKERNERLRAALLEGKNSPIVENFDRELFLKYLHKKYLNDNPDLTYQMYVEQETNI